MQRSLTAASSRCYVHHPGQALYCEEIYSGKSPLTKMLDLKLDKIKQRENKSSSELILSLGFFCSFYFCQIYFQLFLKEIGTLSKA